MNKTFIQGVEAKLGIVSAINKGLYYKRIILQYYKDSIIKQD